jgi:hypothetical protein
MDLKIADQGHSGSLEVPAVTSRRSVNRKRRRKMARQSRKRNRR